MNAQAAVSADTRKAMGRRRIGAIAGMVASPLFAIVVSAQDWSRTDFDPIRQFISELSIGPLGWIQITNFLIHGVLLVVFSRGVAEAFSDSPAPRAGAFLIMIIGLCICLSGIFVTDPAGTPPSEFSRHGLLHVLCGLVVFSLIPLVCLVFYFHFRSDAGWARLRALTLLTALVTGTAWLIIVPGSSVDAISQSFRSWIGVVNRGCVAVWLLWQFSFAARLRRQARPIQHAPETAK